MCLSIIRRGLLKFEGEGVEMLEELFSLYPGPIVLSFIYLHCEVLSDSFQVRFEFRVAV